MWGKPTRREPHWDSTSVVSVRRNVVEVLATEQIPVHAKRRMLVYRSSQYPPAIVWEHFNHARICSRGNMLASTWHRVNMSHCWLYSEATVAVRPQGVAVKVVNTKFKKQPQISSHPAGSLLLGHVVFQQTENISLPPRRLQKEMTGRWFSNTLCQSLPSSQLSLTQILGYRIWQKEYEISFFYKKAS